MVLTKEEFVGYLNFIIHEHKKECKFCDILEEVSGGGGRADIFLYADYEVQLVHLLTQAMQDEERWIEFWIWDCNYGEDADHRVSNELHEWIDLREPANLYDFLVKLYEVKHDF